MKKGFTLIELLVAISIIAVLAALLFPVFSTVRAKARQTTCLSNLKQIGIGIALYAQDSDQKFVLGVDPIDKFTNAWMGTPYQTEATQLPLLPAVLQPYISSKEVWRCPSDTGFDTLDPTLGLTPLTAKPTSFDAYGMSYFYRTELAFREKTLAGLSGVDFTGRQYGVSEINVLGDGDGTWHGGSDDSEKRYNMLMGDGHVKNVTVDAFQAMQLIQVQ